MSSIFTKILKKEIPGEIVYEDNDFFAILDIKPTSPGHVLVMPKKEYEDLHSMNSNEAGEYFKVVQKIANKMKESLDCKAINIGMNNGKEAGQIVFHAHIHIIPRYEEKENINWDGKEYSSKEEMQEYAKKIRF